MSIVRAALACLCGLVAGGATAQAPQSARLVDVGGAVATEVENSDTSTRIRSAHVRASVRAPIPLEGGNALVLGLAYEGQLVRYRDFAATNTAGIPLDESDLPRRLHAIDATFGLLWRFAERWHASAAFTPGLHGDLGEVRTRDVLWGGNLLVVRTSGEEGATGEADRFGFGVAYTDRFGARLPIPLLLVDWGRASGCLFVTGTLPLDLDVGYRVSRPFAVGVGAVLKGHMYRLEATPFDGQVVRYREVQLGPFLDVGFTRRLHVRVRGGISAGHELELRNEANDETLVSGDFRNSAFLDASIYVAL